MDRIHTDHVKYPDHIEIGKAGCRLSVAFNADDLDGAIDRIDHALLVRDYSINALLKEVEKEIKKEGMKKP